LLLAADRAGPAPLTIQIVGQLRTAMTDGQLAPGERLPSTRALAATLGVSRTVVTGAYAQLFAEGWIEGRHGSGTYVADGASASDGSGASAGASASGGAGASAGASASGGAGASAGASASGGAGASAHASRADAGMGEGANGRAADGRAVGGQAADGPVGGQAGWAGPHRPLIELRPGIPWTAGIDRAAWRRAWRKAGAEAPSAATEPQGSAALRAALTGYLRRSRAVRCEPGQVMVTRGVAGSLGLIAAALLRPGDRVGVEEPGYPAARAVFAAHGARLVPCPVDADGLVVDALPAGLRLIYTTPAHQYPLGGRLPVPRRQALIAWARSTGALIVEDDYDGEFRYDVGPLPALFGLDPGVVVYLGTTTKILTPALRVGWLVAGQELVARLAEAAAGLGEWAGGPAQRAVLSLIGTGDLERHVRRMRHEYSRRRAAMTAVLGGGDAGGAGSAGRLLGEEAGMHMVLRTGRDAEEIAGEAWGRGVAVATLARYFAGPVTVNGLVLGYGGASSGEITRACRLLAVLAAGQDAP
jgi:GntR family transcriptional regulator / MocR family aminotransferase